jgi:hypothetical protein
LSLPVNEQSQGETSEKDDRTQHEKNDKEWMTCHVISPSSEQLKGQRDWLDQLMLTPISQDKI